jgi:hypothetical protein
MPNEAISSPFLITRMSPLIPSSWPGLTRPSRKTQGIPSHNWMAGSGPAMTGDRKFANVFKASSADGNIRVIKSPFAKPTFDSTTTQA